LKGEAISSDLFWKYNEYCEKLRKHAKDPMIFGEWIRVYGSNFEDRLRRIEADNRQRCFVANLRIERKHSVAALNEIENEIKTSIDSSTSMWNKIELKKGLERLRRTVINDKVLGLGDGITVSKKQFDIEFADILAPIMTSFHDNSALKLLAYEARNYHDGLNLNRNNELEVVEQTLCRIKELFVSSEEAIRRAIELESKNIQKCRENFDQWLIKKKDMTAEATAIAAEEEKKEKEDKKTKQKAGQRAYTKWLKLRQKNSYNSKLENSIKSVPNVKRADHYNKGWNKDVDLADYYANMEHNFT